MLYNKAKADYLQALKIDPADSTAIKMLEGIKKRLGAILKVPIAF